MDSKDLGQFVGDLFVEDVFDGEGDDGFSVFIVFFFAINKYIYSLFSG
jgi:hypothetical protein